MLFQNCNVFIFRHRKIFIIVTSLLLLAGILYYSNISKSPVRYSIQLQKSDDDNFVNATPINRAVFKTDFNQDFIRFNGRSTFPILCNSCALVSSAGTMLDSKAGIEIDSHDCVLRMNNAPTATFEEDVGSKTTYRIFAHSSVVDVKNYARITPEEVANALFLVWGPKKNLEPGKITNRHLKDIVKQNPDINLHVLSQNRVEDADNRFEMETGKNRMKSGAYLSTGWFSILFAKDICKQIHIYGMVEDDYCEKQLVKLFKDVPYHYYKKGTNQCSTYRTHEYARAGAHRFLTEKRVYKKWAKSWKNIFFHHPEWDLK
uniref:alpha-N-acetylgalactosaminide alpha-2,6-sialyltransferase 3-like n=1 Tax=Styela clava TaxID=7725 RepID=UPI001939DB53|nr:alpha-N-acetylgalactosaminide alpha-2,6-sialyltransferase 3-like [Styela clava]